MLVIPQVTDARLIDSAWGDGNSPTAMAKTSSAWSAALDFALGQMIAVESETHRIIANELGMHISHESIYTAIYAQPAGELRRELVKCLRKAKSTRRPRKAGKDRRGQIPDMVSVHLRPPEVSDHTLPRPLGGRPHQGCDEPLARGRAGGAHDGPGAAGQDGRCLGDQRAGRLHLQADEHGRAGAPDPDLRPRPRHDAPCRADAGHGQVYFCDPRSPWQRAACENANGLICQYLPKGTDLSIHSQDQLDAIADEINNRPRNRLGWDSPLQRFQAIT